MKRRTLIKLISGTLISVSYWKPAFASLYSVIEEYKIKFFGRIYRHKIAKRSALSDFTRHILKEIDDRKFHHLISDDSVGKCY